MLTDIEIAQNAKMKPITEIAEELGIHKDSIEPYGKYMAKLSDEFIQPGKQQKKRKIGPRNCNQSHPCRRGKNYNLCRPGAGNEKNREKCCARPA